MEWNIQLPTEPTANIVLIKNISGQTQEATIKDFFSFCGQIQAFEMRKTNDNELQEAIVYFEQESAAKTATLLSQAVVDDSPIFVEPYFKVIKEPIVRGGTDDTVAEQKQENKPVSHVMTELLASGYVLTESVLAKGIEFDEKHGVSTRMSGYLNKVGINLNRFGSSTTTAAATTTPPNEDLTRSNSAPASTTVASSSSSTNPTRMQSLLKSKAGLRVQGIASRMADKVTNVHEEAKRIAADKKNHGKEGGIDHK
ncbi:hypothetical protein BD770DRAFT_411272 [Pilaira anomala]|nr:hypothetical protein BD770DRAFT_411272 [Pilaira anomala]